MKSISVCIIALAFLVPSAVLAVGKYDREKICPKEKDNFSACDLLVEQAVAKDILGIIERKGAVLRIHLRNGKILERKNVGTDSGCESCYVMSACGYLPAMGYLEICYTGWEWHKTEFVNINSGRSVAVDGQSFHSPLERRAVIVESSDGGVDMIEIWRFDRKRPVKEFHMEPPSGEDEEEVSSWPRLRWFDVVWKSETEIQVNGPPDESPSSYRLVKKGRKWEFKEK